MTNIITKILNIQEQYPHTVYKITNLITNRYYIGKRTEEPDEHLYFYMGSSNFLDSDIEKYGLENFEKVILKRFRTAEEAYRYENEIIDLKDPLIYNKVKQPGKFNTAGTKWIHNPETMKEMLIEKDSEVPENWVEGRPEGYKQKIAAKMKGNQNAKGSKSNIGRGADYIVISPENIKYLVESPKLWTQEHFPDDWQRVNVALVNTAAGRQKSFRDGWVAEIVNG